MLKITTNFSNASIKMGKKRKNIKKYLHKCKNLRTFAAFSGMRGLTRPLIFILQPQSVNRILTDKLTDTLSVVLMTVWGLIIGI